MTTTTRFQALQDEFKSFVRQRPAKGLVTVKIIAEHRSVQRGEAWISQWFDPLAKGQGVFSKGRAHKSVSWGIGPSF